MPADVTEFLQHVHAEKAKFKSSTSATAAKETSTADDDNQIYYYNTDNEFSTILGQDPATTWERRNKRMFNYIIDLPLGDYSSDWYLVTNDAIGNKQTPEYTYGKLTLLLTHTSKKKLNMMFPDDLLADSSSFIYGQSPSTGSVPIYAMVKLCNSTNFEDQQQESGKYK